MKLFFVAEVIYGFYIKRKKSWIGLRRLSCLWLPVLAKRQHLIFVTVICPQILVLGSTTLIELVQSNPPFLKSKKFYPTCKLDLVRGSRGRGIRSGGMGGRGGGIDNT